MVVSVVLVTFISLTFVGAAILMQMQIGQMKDYWSDRAQVAVYMCTAISRRRRAPTARRPRSSSPRSRRSSKSRPLAPLITEFYFEDHDAGVRERSSCSSRATPLPTT